ncbi:MULTISPECIES: hypothetical protein [unclassified Pseudoxanthomonas]|uniref:hypothetical protein n=1 Tax=unclassified Pseudoxanthomonas TaxID=2645906 RepID=UPI0030775D18
MSILLSLKEWLTLDEAAQHLSAVFQENVSIADLYRFALGKHLVLSANFVNHGRARLGRKMAIRDAGFRVMPSLSQGEETGIRLSISETALPEFEAWLERDPSRKQLLESKDYPEKMVLLNGNQISATECISFSKHVSSIDGLWDLPMIGAERLDIEHALQQEVGGPPIELMHLDGTYVCDDSGQFAWLQEHWNDNEYATEAMRKKPWSDSSAYFPAGGIPKDVVVVVRPSKLLEFIGNATGQGQEKPLEGRERNSLLRIIRALDVMAKLPTRGPAVPVQKQLEQLGFTGGPGEATIRKWIDEARTQAPDSNPQ